MEIIDTPRLRLRMMVEGDEALYCRLYSDAEVMRHIAVPLAWEAARRSFRTATRQAAERPLRRPWWVVHEHAAKSDIGVVGLVIEDDTAELGIVLLVDGQGRGLGAEALAALADSTIGAGLARRLLVRHAPTNTAMSAIAGKLGFSRGPDGEGPDWCCWWLDRQAAHVGVEW